MLHKALSASAGVEMHHEYMVHIVQPLGGAPLYGPGRRRRAEAGARRNPCRRRPLQRKSALGRFVEQTFLADPRACRTLAAGEIRSSGARRAQSRRALISTSSATNVTTTAPRRSCARMSTIRSGLRRRRRRKNIGGRCRAKTIPLAARSPASTNSSGSAWHWAEINRVILEALAQLSPHRKACSCGWRICAAARCGARAL